MKNLVIALVVLMGVSSTTFAADNNNYFKNLVTSELSVKTLDGLKFRVTATDLSEKSTIEIKDLNGKTLYKEVVSTENFAKVFNMNSLPDGNYNITLTTGGVTFAKPFTIETETKRIATPVK